MTIDQLQLTALRLLKVDVEGMEYEVLRGATDTVRRLQPVLYVENNRDPKSPAVVRLLDQWQYRCYWHFAACFDPANNFYNHTVQPATLPISVNMLCLPPGSPWTLQGMDPVEVPVVGHDADWLQRHKFF